MKIGDWMKINGQAIMAPACTKCLAKGKISASPNPGMAAHDLSFCSVIRSADHSGKCNWHPANGHAFVEWEKTECLNRLRAGCKSVYLPPTRRAGSMCVVFSHWSPIGRNRGSRNSVSREETGEISGSGTGRIGANIAAIFRATSFEGLHPSRS